MTVMVRRKIFNSMCLILCWSFFFLEPKYFIITILVKKLQFNDEPLIHLKTTKVLPTIQNR